MSYLPNSSSQPAEEKNSWQCGNVADIAFSYLVLNLIIWSCLINSCSTWSEKLPVFWKGRLHLFIISIGRDIVVVNLAVIVLPTVRKFQRLSPYWYSWTRNFCSVLIWSKYLLRYSLNANSQSEPTAKLDVHIFKNLHWQNYIFQGSRAIFFSWITGVFRRGREWMVTNLAKHHCHFSPGQGEDKKLSTYYPAIYFSLSLKRPVYITHTEVDEPQVLYTTCALYPLRTLPCPHCAPSASFGSTV